MRAVARRQDCDDVLFVSVDEPPAVAVVHLTYANRPELDPRWPRTTFFDSMQVCVPLIGLTVLDQGRRVGGEQPTPQRNG